MGLKTLEWHQQQCRHTGRMGWVVRVAIPYNTEPGKSDGRVKYRRFAHVDILPDWAQRVKGKVPVQFQPPMRGNELTWHDSIEAAKLHVEAVFALDND
jgi:hypothetical protein